MLLKQKIFAVLLFGVILPSGTSTLYAQFQQQQLRKQLAVATEDSTRIKLLLALATVSVTNNEDTALAVIERALEIRKRSSFNKYDYQLLIKRGMIYMMGGLYAKAHQSHMEYLNLSEQNNDSAHIAIALMCISNTYFRQNDMERAISYAEKSFATHDANPTLALMYHLKYEYMKGNYHKALKLSKLALEKVSHTQPYDKPAAKNEKFNQEISLLGHIGTIHVKMEKFDSAVIYIEKSLQLCKEVNNNRMAAMGYRNLGDIHQKKADFATAVFSFNQALYYSKQLHSNQQLLESYEKLSRIHDTIGNYQLSKAYLDSVVMLQDAIYNQSKARQIEELTIQYETTKKEKQIAKLEIENTKAKLESSEKDKWLTIAISSASGLFLIIVLLVVWNRSRKKQREATFAQKRAELEQQALRAQMNPHFLFNALSNLQSLYNEGQEDKANDLMADFSRLLRMILNHTSKQQVSLAEEIEALKLYLNIEQERLDGSLRYDIKLEDAVDSDITMIPPMVVQPFIENAIWHGIVPKGKGTVSVSFKQISDEMMECIILDDGIGIETSKSQKTSKHHESKGINLSAERLGGQHAITIEELKTGGTRVTLQIPINYED